MGKRRFLHSAKKILRRFRWSAFRMRTPSMKKSKPKRIDRARSESMKVRKAVRFMKTFKVRQLAMNIDTGDCIQNSRLYPVFAFLDYKYGGFNINFVGRNEMILHVQNTPLRMAKSFI